MNVIRELRKSKKLSQKQLADMLFVNQTAVSQWERNVTTPNSVTLKKLSELFDVSIDYILGNETSTNAPGDVLTERDNRDIAKDLDSIMEKLSRGEAGPASYNGEELDPEAAELFKEELKIALKRLKLINKEKYTPKKYKADKK